MKPSVPPISAVVTNAFWPVSALASTGGSAPASRKPLRWPTIQRSVKAQSGKVSATQPRSATSDATNRNVGG